MNISVIGTGYVGLVAGACFADSGNKVYCVDIDDRKIQKLKQGEIPIYEPGLKDIVDRNIEHKRIHFTTNIEEGVDHGEIIFIAVGTPSSVDGSADLKYVLEVARSIAKSMKEHKIVVLKSTVPVGTHALVATEMKTHTKISFDIVNNPEFLKEGSAIDDFAKPERVVVGTSSQAAYDKMASLYSPFVRQGNPIIHMDNKSAEITKYACNAFLATRISFMNDMANLCDAVGADIEMIRKGMATDSRIGKYFLYPGVGYGGSCFPKDVKAILKTAKENGKKLEVIQSAEDVNDKQKFVLFEKISKHYNGNLKGKKIAVWGLAFKPNTDDMREAPSITIINNLLANGAEVTAYDPEAHETAKPIFENKIKYAKDPYEAIQNADALAIVTEWSEFRNPDFALLKQNVKDKVIFDGRNIYNSKEIRSLGFTYYSIGRL